MSDIFISHAVADKQLAKLLVDFLKEAIGVPDSAIFCSSVKGHHIPLGEDFNVYIKHQIQGSKLVILLMTPAYMESSFLFDGTWGGLGPRVQKFGDRRSSNRLR